MATLAAVSRALPATLALLSSSASSSSRTARAASTLRSRALPSALGFTLAFSSAAASAPVRAMESVRADAAASSTASGSALYDFVVKDIGGNDIQMSQYKGKVLLIVNVASACGLTTTNYTELAEIYNKYKGQDFEILAFPCNQFGGQEPGSNEQIKNFACTRFKAEYPIMDKVDVNGSREAPLYKFLKSQKGGGLLGDSIKWNFGKFLVDKNGNVVDRYAPTTPPSKIEKDIKKYLSS